MKKSSTNYNASASSDDNPDVITNNRNSNNNSVFNSTTYPILPTQHQISSILTNNTNFAYNQPTCVSYSQYSHQQPQTHQQQQQSQTLPQSYNLFNNQIGSTSMLEAEHPTANSYYQSNFNSYNYQPVSSNDYTSFYNSQHHQSNTEQSYQQQYHNYQQQQQQQHLLINGATN
jgi:hypothetical protein